MDVRRLRLLLELSRLGSMREVADELGLTTSTVSQQIASLAREAGTALVEPDGRRVRLTPAGHRLAEHPVGIGDVDGSAQGRHGVRVFAAEIDVPLARADGIRRDRHSLDEGEGVAFDEHPVGEGPGIALIGIAADELDVGGGGAHGLPLDARGEAGAASAAQPGGGDFADDLLGGQGEGAAEAGEPAQFPVGRDVRRLDPPNADKGHSMLTREPGVLLDDAQ